MLKWAGKLLLWLFLILALFAGMMLHSGYNRYQKAIAELPLETAVENIRESGRYVPYEAIDPDYVNAVVAVEDQRYFTRRGFDFIALIRSVLSNFRQRRAVEGGSTIPQQTAKNLYFIGEGKVRDADEKVAEIFLMYDMEEHYTKEEILALYAALNYYGDGYWGLENASQGYYGISCSDLSPAKAAMLAGIPNAPSVYQLSSGYNLARSRQKRVLSDMQRDGYLSSEEVQQALLEDVHALSKGE